MYASIDLVSHRLTRLLRKYKDRKLGKRKEMNFEEDTDAEIDAMNAAISAAAGAVDGAEGASAGFQDPSKLVDLRVVKRKQFDMPAMSVSLFVHHAFMCVCFFLINGTKRKRRRMVMSIFEVFLCLYT